MATTKIDTTQIRGLGSAATVSASAFMQGANNLSEVSSPSGALANLGGAPNNAHFWTDRSEALLTNEVNLGGLATGLVKVTVSTGVAIPSKAVAGVDYYAPNFSGALDTISGLLATHTNVIQSVSGVWASRTPAQHVATFPTMSGDLTGNLPNATLKNTGPGATGPIGDATHSSAVTIDAQGRVTALSPVAITAVALGDHGCRVNNSAAISIANATATLLTFDSERWDTDAYHSTSSSTGRIVIPAGQSGKYLVGASVAFAPNAIGERFVYILLNGGNSQVLVRGNTDSVGGADTGINPTCVLSLVATDYLELGVYQTSGGALNIERNADWSPEFWCQRLA